jgi:ArsR family transcriptional regulator
MKRGVMNPVQFYKCLADETRLRCLLLIEQEQELCVCELMKAIDEIQPKVSRHLAQLRRCNLLEDRRQGQWVFYRINPALPDWAKTVLARTLQSNPSFLAKNIKRLHKMGDRPVRAQACC